MHLEVENGLLIDMQLNWQYLITTQTSKAAVILMCTVNNVSCGCVSNSTECSSRNVHHGLFITECSPRNVRHRMFTTECSPQNVHHGKFITECSSRKVHHGMFITECSSRNGHHGMVITSRGTYFIHFMVVAILRYYDRHRIPYERKMKIIFKNKIMSE
jgi:hypothetical protein